MCSTTNATSQRQMEAENHAEFYTFCTQVSFTRSGTIDETDGMVETVFSENLADGIVF